MSAPTFDWEEFLDPAEELVRRRGNAGADRSAISRAYYAAFHRANDYVGRRGANLTFTGRDHSLVWDWFLEPASNERSRWVGETGHWLRRARRRADYGPAASSDAHAEAEPAVRLARRLLSELNGAS